MTYFVATSGGETPFSRHFASVLELYVPRQLPQVVITTELQLNFMRHVRMQRAQVGQTQSRTATLTQNLKTSLRLASFAVMLVVAGWLSWLYLPGLVTQIWPTLPQQMASATSGTALGGAFDQGSVAFEPAESNPEVAAVAPVAPTRYLPPIDENLPEGSWIMIPKIGVVTQLQWTEIADEALVTGVWAVPEYGLPGALDKPMIVAAHRYGYKWMWEGDYWKYHTFNLLPDTEPGDVVEIIHDQRKWTYEIYAGELNQEITDYSADLILYTCRFVTGDDRYIRYARLIDQDQDSQVE